MFRNTMMQTNFVFRALVIRPLCSRTCKVRNKNTGGSKHRVVDLNLSDANVHKQWSKQHLQWLMANSLWEPYDQEALDNPISSIIFPGGRIVGIFIDGRLAASVAMKPIGEVSGLRWEILKLATSPEFKRMGLGNQIFAFAISHCKEKMQQHVNSVKALKSEELKEDGVYTGKVQAVPVIGVIQMDSSTKLSPALAMYSQYGFKKIPGKTQYLTADVFLELSIPFLPNTVSNSSSQ